MKLELLNSGLKFTLEMPYVYTYGELDCDLDYDQVGFTEHGILPVGKKVEVEIEGREAVLFISRVWVSNGSIYPTGFVCYEDDFVDSLASHFRSRMDMRSGDLLDCSVINF